MSADRLLYASVSLVYFSRLYVRHFPFSRIFLWVCIHGIHPKLLCRLAIHKTDIGFHSHEYTIRLSLKRLDLSCHRWIWTQICSCNGLRNKVKGCKSFLLSVWTINHGVSEMYVFLLIHCMCRFQDCCCQQIRRLMWRSLWSVCKHVCESDTDVVSMLAGGCIIVVVFF